MYRTLSLSRSWKILPVTLLIVIGWAISQGYAQIYKYQKDGVWYYTDTPTEALPDNSQEITDAARVVPSAEADGAVLLADHPARSPIEKATAGTVAIQSDLGFGSGFFISADGYIITNKHVIRTTEVQKSQSEDYFNQAEDRIKELDRQFSREADRLKNFKASLDSLKETAEAETNSRLKQAYMEDYKRNLEIYQQNYTEFERQRRQYQEEKQQFRSDRQSHYYGKIVADLSQSFTIFLVDNTRHFVRLVAVSNRYDLALLKLDGFQVPSLMPTESRRMIQGAPLFAIGSPVKLKNSVTSGVFSGYEQGFIQTDTRIYPGNSGGPLVDAQGNVVGINTFKKITHDFEGLGFAIPIQIALEEFAAYLGD
jgi:S1-C subfamily serine protease